MFIRNSQAVRQWKLAMSIANCLSAFWILMSSSIPSVAQTPYEDTHTPEGWALSQIKTGQGANFNQRCGSESLRPGAAAVDSCRTIPAKFVVDMLSVSKWSQQLPSTGLRLKAAYIQGSIDLSYTHVTIPIVLKDSYIRGDFIIDRTALDRFLEIDGTQITGDFRAQNAKLNDFLALTDSTLHSVNMNGITISGVLSFDKTRVDADVLLRRSVISDTVYAVDASIENIILDNATINGAAFLIAHEYMAR